MSPASFVVVAPHEGHAVVVEAGSEVARSELENIGSFLDDWDVGTPPSGGLWIWEGAVHVSGGGYYDPYDVDVRWYGSWRRATAAEVWRFSRGERLLSKDPSP